ncbi:TPA: hypothetical protein NJ548_003149 [Vibrio parahaemolyticus]|uniref:hypothetical protein n=1 Tax=Vibrio parahaemolyticus TaxID=670 RepID=UPI00146F04EC|nr:hypothetical protein [Vibrio parahaemolyticus]MDF4417115.1 hypothetical protein [Vibrio parahaemolyticus]MDF5116054.1 hypothetical protein [Vibrio parahaemolyticus]MDF5390306.1 hypothetical protein [Vibrio parahaemolyticus]MDF5396939.1 hypothetical protein [Vibrio parahaemolyticus]MDF5536691.1 hypothetical protein [Vibrio parahaemolyticus]
MIKFLVSLYFYDELITGYLTVPLWRLEPYAVKVARTVLRRAALGNECHLSDRSVLCVGALMLGLAMYTST